MARAKHLCGSLALLLSACSLSPPLQLPMVPTAVVYKELGPWTPALPADRLPRNNWWTLYDNAELDQLVKRLIDGNPNIALALANYDQAKALSDEARAGLFLTLGLGGGAQRAHNSANSPVLAPTAPRYYDDIGVGGSLGYELDLWGRIRNTVLAGKATAAAAADDLENARLALVAQLVQNYVQLRAIDRQSAILDDTVQVYSRALSLTRERHAAGIAPGLDVAQAETQLSSTRSQAAQTLVARALLEHAIAALLGVSASTFSVKPAIIVMNQPAIPTGVPTTLLERRPDVSAAERRMIAANAGIGVARAAFFPSLTLDALGGFQSSSMSNLMSAPSSYWALGPNALLPLFDGGLRRAQLAQARAAFAASAANYRETVVGAFQQVEDSLASLNHYSDAAVEEKAAVDAAQRTLKLSMALYLQGAADYLTVVNSQTALLQAQLQQLNLDTLRLTASVDLVRALGGGWQEPATAAVDKPAFQRSASADMPTAAPSRTDRGG